MSQLVLHIEVNSPQEFKKKVKELYDEFFPPMLKLDRGVTPVSSVRMGSNTLTSFDKVYDYVKANTEIGERFSSTTVKLMLNLKAPRMQYALRRMRDQGVARMLQRGIWERII